MSFALKIVDKDLVFDGSGKLETVTGSDKLVQGLNKILVTERGRNFLHQQYGSTLYNLLGKKFSSALMTSLLSKNLAQTLACFQQIQQNQRMNQYVAPSEIIASVDSIVVARMGPAQVAFNTVLRTLNGAQIRTLTNIQNT